MPRDHGATFRVGIGYDSHRFAPGRPLKLGGVTIPSDVGLLGHSDADAICHAVTDANGRASCQPFLPIVILTTTYTASFAGDATSLPSTATAPVIGLLP